MDGRKISKSKLLSRVSVLAVIASTGTIGPVRDAMADCIVITTPEVITGTHECVEARFVNGNVTNDGTIGPPEDSEAGFFVGKGGITGVLTNNNLISGGGYSEYNGLLGALTIETNVSGGVINRGEITSYSGNGIQLGLSSSESGWGTPASMTGSITNSGTISAGESGIAALFGTMTKALVNESDGWITGERGVEISSDFTNWSGGISNSGRILGERAGVQIGRDYYSDDGDVVFSGGFVNESTGTINGETGPAIIIGGWEFSDGLTNHGLITQVLPDEYENEYAGIGILVTANTFNDGITNTGTIDGFDGPAIWITNHTNQFNGGITNSGSIVSVDSGILVESYEFSGTIDNSGTIKGGSSGTGVAILADYFSGNFTNSGTITGGYAGVVIDGTEGVFSGEDDGPAVFNNSGTIAGGFAGLYFGGSSVNADVTNTGSGVIGGGSGAGLIIASSIWDGNINNSGKIQGGQVGLLAGGDFFFFAESEGTSISRVTEEFTGSLVNSGLISGTSVGLYVTAGSFDGSITNSGTIQGGVTGAYISATTFEGQIFNDGIISGGVNVEGYQVPNDPGLVVVTGTHTGNIINAGTLDAGSNALVLDIGTLTGSVTNTGLIEATTIGTTAVQLDIDNGTIFTNTGGGIIKGDVIFGGTSSAYQFIGEGGGVEGNLTGEGGESSNDDSIVVRNGTQYFVAQGLTGVASADNFSSFTIKAGGIALMGAKTFGSPGGNGYDLNNVGALNLNSNGHLYVDNQSTLNVGTFTQVAGSTLSFYLSEPAVAVATPGTHYGQIRTDSVATLDGTLQAVVDPLAFAGTGTMTFVYNDVISGVGPITTDFDTVQISGGSAFLTLTRVIDDNTVDLLLTRNAFTTPSCSANGNSLGQLLEILFQGGNLSPSQQALFNYLIQLPPDQVCDVFQDAVGESLADFTAIVVETAGPWKSLVNDRLNGLGSVGCSLAGEGGCLNRFAANETGASQVMTDATPGTDPFDWLQTGTRRVGETAAWGRLIGSWGGTSSAPGAPGMDYELSGGIVGIDHVFTPLFLAGVAAQYTTDDIDFSKPADDADIDSFEIGTYASWGDTRLYLNANVSFIWHEFGIRRFLDSGTALGEYSGTTFSAYVEGGKIFEADDWRIQPIVAASFAHLETDAYVETGSALTKLSVEGSTLTNFKSVIGARVALPIEIESGRKIVPEARAVWAHEYADDHSTMRAQVQGVPGTITVNGRKFARDSLVVGAGISAPLSDEASIMIDYDASINPDMVSHTLSAGFRLKW